MPLPLRILVGMVATLLVGLCFVAIVVQSFDGPVAIIAGGPFTSGERYSGPEPDWEFLRDREEVEFQLLDPARSRTTWIAYHEGKIYIPSGYMNTAVGKLWKRWPHEAMADGRALLRVDGQIYERELVRVMTGPAVLPVLAELKRKYIPDAEISSEPVESGALWLFELAARAPQD